MVTRICLVGECKRVLDEFERTGYEGEVKKFDMVSELLMWIFKARLTGTEVTFETECWFVCFGEHRTKKKTSSLDQIDLQGVSILIRDTFPCFNMVCIGADEFVTYFNNNLSKRGVSSLSSQLDRISSVYRWMYSDSELLEADSTTSTHSCANPSLPCCSGNMYTMASHLAFLSCEAKKKYDSFSLWDHLDVIDLVKSNLQHEDPYYWDCLNGWEFCAHSLSYMDLIWCSALLLVKLAKDARLRKQPELNRLLLMLFNIESSYHKMNKFHNFRHAVDVLQATYRLCQILEIPKLSSFLLCIAAIGHDVGHPGTNNMLFNKFNSPISKFYNSGSVLENFHADVYTDILARYWPELSEEFGTIKNSIIATDMALHNHYVETIQSEMVPKLPSLTSLIIKAADISNVTRPLLISAKWAVLISMEFAECSLLEKNLSNNDSQNIVYKIDPALENCKIDLPSTMEEILEKYENIPKGQLFFIDTFALSLFSGLSEKFQQLQFLLDNVENNRKFWQSIEGPKS